MFLSFFRSFVISVIFATMPVAASTINFSGDPLLGFLQRRRPIQSRRIRYYTLVCFKNQKDCVVPKEDHEYYLYGKATRWTLPGAKDVSTLAFFEDWYGAYRNQETVALMPLAKGESVGIFILHSSSEVGEAQYDSAEALWNDLTFNAIKRKQLMSNASPVLTVTRPLKVYMVLAAQKGTVGTVVVADQIDKPSVVMYVMIPVEMKDATIPLERLKRGDSVSAVGKVFSAVARGTGIGANPYANAIHMSFGRIIRE